MKQLRLISPNRNSSKRHSAEFERYRQTDVIAMRLMTSGQSYDDAYSQAFEIVACGDAEAFIARTAGEMSVRDRADALSA
jgi:hypothetical protein